MWQLPITSVCGIVARNSTVKALFGQGDLFDGIQSFNAGILLMDLSVLRAADFTQWAMSFVLQYKQHDQATLAYFCHNQHNNLPEEWNVYTGTQNTDPALIHYA